MPAPTSWWARVSPPPAIAENRRVRPTRIAPVTLFMREDADWECSLGRRFDNLGEGFVDALRGGWLRWLSSYVEAH